MSDVQNFYTNVFKAWPANLRGPKPTADMLTTVHNLGARPGKQALAIAMALRDGGVTGNQIVMACGAPQLNKMRGFITDALLKKHNVPPSSEGHTVYKLTVTPKGEQRIKRSEAAAAKAVDAAKADPGTKPAKAKKAASKPRKAKVTPVDVTETPAAIAAEMAHENGATTA